MYRVPVSIVMSGSLRGPSIRAEFEDVLETVGRGFAARFGEDVAAEEAAAGPAPHASFEFLRALDGVSDRQAMPAARAGGPAGRYAEMEVEPEDEAAFEGPPPTEPESPGEPVHGDGREAGHRVATMSQACDPASLAAELGLRAGMTRAELQRLRRSFALENHPDRLGPAQGETASRRMTIANALIDAALRRAI
jgi:hypothetical protein